MEEHRLEDIVQRTVALMAHDLEMKEMRLICSCEPDLPMVRCDSRQIQQALLNLMINATEAMTKGGVLTVRARRASKEGFVTVSVSDTGCGIPEENLSQIFEPFFTTKEEARGVGLGLTVVQGIVTRHGGTIEVESQVGVGTTFHITLPSVEASESRGDEVQKAEVGP
jgi:two-component system NtrC family sensor kinase